MAQWNTCFLLIGVFLHYFETCTDAVEVTARQGKLAGVVMESRNGTKFYAFLGIPYAKPPVEKLRFESPQEPDGWDDVRNATVPPPTCPQTSLCFTDPCEPQMIGQEDCLYLNIYTPSITNDKNLPVIIFIHGGAFIIGAGTLYQPHYFMDNPVVFVTFNYRLGTFGFLSAADEVLPGNYGLKDQVAALKWVKKNVAAFGGNPNKITLFGESAGGISVHFHMHSSLSKGLFEQAVAQSGSALGLTFQIPPEIARQKALAFGVLSGCPTKSTRNLVDCLKKIPAEDLLQIHQKFYFWDIEPAITFPIVAEPESVSDAFLVEYPWNQKVINDVPLILGVNSGEGGLYPLRIFLGQKGLADYFAKYVDRLLPLMLGFSDWLPEERISNTTKSLRNFYFGDKELNKNVARELTDLFGDGIFTIGSMEAALRHTAEVYFYYYDHRGLNTYTGFFGKHDWDLGTIHGDDLISTFPPLIPFPDEISGVDLEVSKRMINYWINFATTGNPNGENDIWQPLQSNEFEYLHITSDGDKMEKNLLKDRLAFWKNLRIYTANIPKKSSYKDEL